MRRAFAAIQRRRLIRTRRRRLFRNLGLARGFEFTCSPRKQRETLFADGELDKWDEALDNEWDAADDHWGKDFVDLEQERLDALCESLFHGPSFPGSRLGTHRMLGSADFREPTPALGAGLLKTPIAAALTNTPPAPSHCPLQTATQSRRSRSARQRTDNIRSRFGVATLLLSALFAAFCFYKHAGEDTVTCLPIEQIDPIETPDKLSMLRGRVGRS